TAKEFLDRLEGMPSNSADVIESGRKVYKKMAELLSVATKQPNGYPTDKEWFFLLATGNYPGARSAVLALSDEDYRDYAWPYLVEWSLLVGDSEQALADACQVSPKNSHYRLRSLLAVAEATRRSEILKANAGFGVRLEEKDKLDWYCGLIDRLVKLGDMDGARALALESVDLLRNAKYSHHHRSLGLAFAKAEDFENARRVSKGMTEKLNQSLGVEPWDRCQYQRYPIEIQGACVATMAKAWSREKVQTELEKLPPEDRVNALVELAYMAQPWTMEWAPMAYIKYMSGDGVPKDPQLAKKIFLDTLPKAEDGELTLMARNVAADPIGNDPELALLATARILEFLKKDFIQDYDRTRLLETAAACYARTGQFDHAIETQQQALDRLKEIEGVRRSAQLRMWVYKQKKPCNFLDW
ncbi:MAG: hypothetical protein L6Q38_17050, partial [Nitrospira sp.]|nr:hypothetical protein [Nitrospira sp.]